jgi:hypothetical protein
MPVGFQNATDETHHDAIRLIFGVIFCWKRSHALKFAEIHLVNHLLNILCSSLLNETHQTENLRRLLRRHDDVVFIKISRLSNKMKAQQIY